MRHTTLSWNLDACSFAHDKDKVYQFQISKLLNAAYRSAAILTMAKSAFRFGLETDLQYLRTSPVYNINILMLILKLTRITKKNLRMFFMKKVQ